MTDQTQALSKFRKEAKRLKKSYAVNDSKTLERVHSILGQDKSPQHADFLYIIAREQGHSSWPKLKFAIESSGMSREQKRKSLRSALFHGHKWRVQRLLSEEPVIAEGQLDLQIALYDFTTVKKAIERDPSLVQKTIHDRLPLHHLCFSHYIHIAPERKDDMLAMAKLLLDCGAEINLGMPPIDNPGDESDHLLSPLYGALGHANNMVLTAWLLENGANPDDDESLYHATELGHHQGLQLLIKHGVNPSGTNALARALDFDDEKAVQLLLDHGADPNEAAKEHPSGQAIDSIPALHQAARRRCQPAIARLLLKHGADGSYIWQGHSPYALALIHDNEDFAQELESANYGHALSPAEEILVSCAKGVVPDKLLSQLPNDLSDKLKGDDHLLINKLITEPDRLDHVKALVASGLRVDQLDGMKLPPLHLACWAGLPEQVAYLLSFSPDLEQLNGFGGTAFHTVLHGASNCPERQERDHIACVKLLLEAGVTFSHAIIQHCGNESMAFFLESWLEEQQN